jgi:hypothetical protein
MILFACKRFGDAIAYLWESDYRIQACHLSLLSCYYGLTLPHIPLTSNPPLLVTDGNITTDISPTYLIIEFMSATLSGWVEDVNERLDYLTAVSLSYQPLQLSKVLIGMDSPAIEVVEHELRIASDNVLKLFVRSLSSKELSISNISSASSVSSNRVSRNGNSSNVLKWLSTYLGGVNELNRLLSSAAFEALNVEHDAATAVALFEVVGDYAEAVHQVGYIGDTTLA